MDKELQKTDRGMALVLVLWVLTLLSVMVLEFCFAMRTELGIARHEKEAAELYFFAQGAVHRAIAELIYRHDPALHQKRTAPKLEESPELEKEWEVDGSPYTVSFKGGEAEVRIQGESGRINLNRIPEGSLRRVMEFFLEVGQERDVVVDSILDWRDSDDLHRINGAENDYYRSLAEPYDCKNGDFDSVEELLLVRGVTPELFYGKRAKGDGEENPKIGLRDIFTVYSMGSQIDVNVARAEVLMAIFKIPAEVAKKIVATRKEKAFSSLADLQQRVPEIIPFAPGAQGLITFSSTAPYYYITSLAKTKSGEARRGVECVVKIDRREKIGYRIVMWKDTLS